MSTVRFWRIGSLIALAEASAVACTSGAPGGASPDGGSAAVAATPSAESATPVPSRAFAGESIDIVAKDRKFSESEIEVAAGSAFQIRFDNEDEFKHAIYIVEGPRVYYATFEEYSAGPAVFKGEYTTGPLTVVYEVPALTPGQYTFLCPPHREMTGTLVVK